MRKKDQKSTRQSEFPILDKLNLYASCTTGDGNCLFRALSDQVYGDETKHKEIRKRVVEYVNSHADHFSAFVGEFGETFDQYIARLSQDGVFGGHIELVGFASEYNKVIVIYQSENLYLIHPEDSVSSKSSGSVHIAYHEWEHYSSVRQIGGPRTGPVQIKIPTDGGQIDVEKRSGDADNVPAWKVDIVLKSVPDANEEQITQMLRVKDYDLVIEELLMADDNNAFTTESEGKPELGEPSKPVIEETEEKKPVSMTERKATAKQKRNEKKERVRIKKQKPKNAVTDELGSSGANPESETTKVDIKIVSI